MADQDAGRLTVARLNAVPAPVLRQALLTCARVDRWADEIVAGRPYATRADVLTTVRAAADPWTDDEVAAALARHPRIGERAERRSGDVGGEAALARAEQSGVDVTDIDVARRLAEGNRAYEERFGHVFLVRAAGRDASEILAVLDERLANDPSTEARVVAQNLREIALLRLEGMLEA